MTFEFNAYSTPLLFGWVQGWLFAILFFIRAWRSERLSDWLFGCLLGILTFEIWEYMLGFAGIEILWKELDFFPRGFGLLLPPVSYFYFRSLVNDQFQFKKSDWWHAFPFLLVTLYHLIVFAFGPDFVAEWRKTVHHPYHIDILVMVFGWLQGFYYFVLAWRLYREYRNWAPSQFSDTQTMSFSWYRNFLVAMMASLIVSVVMTVLSFSLDLSFWKDWWDELFQAGLIYYLGINAYAQPIARELRYQEVPSLLPSEAPEIKTERFDSQTLAYWKGRLEASMQTEKPWLDPDLTLIELARRLNTTPTLLSAVVNDAFEKNFNDYVNTYRVEAVQDALRTGQASHLSLLGIGLECGFNSKSTFNRAFKKVTGMAPSEWKIESDA